MKRRMSSSIGCSQRGAVVKIDERLVRAAGAGQENNHRSMQLGENRIRAHSDSCAPRAPIPFAR